MRWLALIALSVAFAAPQAEAKSVNKTFLASWLARDNQYVSDAKAAADKQNAAIDAFRAALSTNAPDTVNLMDYMFTAVEEYEYKNARGEMLRNFRIHMLSKPESEQTGLWMQERLDNIKSDTADTQKKAELVGKLSAEKAEFPKVFAALEEAYRSRGRLRGLLDELTLIDQNLNLLHEARAEDRQRRQAFWQALSRAGQSMQAAGQAMEANRMRFTTCHPVGSFVSCTTM